MVRGGRPKEMLQFRERVDPAGERVCPFMVAACLVAGRRPEADALCWRIRCQLWEPNRLACRLEVGR